MLFSEQQKSDLSAPLDRKHVAQRKQAGRDLSYIEGWHAIAEANRIFGFDAWNRETVELRMLGDPILGKDKFGNDQWRANYMARVRITVFGNGGEAVVRDGCGFGQGIDKDVGQAHESALKEAETDAMKRALMTFGNPFGLALYDKSQANVVTQPTAPKAATATEELTSAQLDAIAAIDTCETLPRLQAWGEAYGHLFPDGTEAKRLAGIAFQKRQVAIKAMDRAAA